MLGLGGDGVGRGDIVALQTADRFPGKGGAQAGVLAVAFLAAAIARVADQVHDRAVCFVNTAGACLRRDGAAHLVAKRRLKACGQADLLGEACRAAGVKAVERFLTEKERDAKAGLLHSVALDGVGLSGGHAAQLYAAHAAFAEQLVKPVKIDRRSPAVFIDGCEIAGPVLVGLGDLFLGRHPGKQVVNAGLNRLVWILIRIHGDASFVG